MNEQSSPTTGELELLSVFLDDLVERSARRPDVDGLQLWFDVHFEETAEGLKLFDWAGDEINGILEEAAGLEEQLSKTDF